MRNLLIFVLVFLMAGCATNRNDAEIARVKYKAMENLNKPLFTMKCPPSGCVFEELSVNNPNQVTLPKETNGWDFANKVVDGVVRIAPHAATAYVAAEGIRAAAGAINNSYNDSTADSNNSTSTTNTTDTTTTSTNTTETSNTDSGNTTTTTTDTTNTDSGNTTTTTATDTTTTTTTTTTDSTHEPTVVTQPEPVVVP
jgi:hypothetical protein